MFTRTKPTLLLMTVLGILMAVPAVAQKKNEQAPSTVPVIWRAPSEISNRNLTYGPGSAELAPLGPFTFVKEESTGESPKFNVTDARGETWVVKVGPEA